MSSFWSNVTGRGSGEKPPSGRSRSVSRSKDGEPQRGRPATRERPQDHSREDDDSEKQAARNDKEGDGCLNMSRLAGQVLGRSGGRGVLRVGLLPAFTRAGRTGSLPHTKRQPSTEPPGLSTPTPPPTPTQEHHPPVPDSPKPKVKGVGRKRAASASPTRDKRRSFGGISRDRLPPLPHLPHLPSLPPQLRNILHRGGDSDHRMKAPSPNKPSRRPGPVGRTWVKVYDDITFMDEQKEEEEEMYPMMGYTGRPPIVPDASPLPTPPTPPPPRARQRRSSSASEYDNVPKDRASPDRAPEPEVLDRHSPTPEPLAPATESQPRTDHDEPKNSMGQGRGRERFRGRRQKRTGTPVGVGRGEYEESQVEAFEAARLAALEAEIIVAPQEEEDYIIPQALQPPRPPRGHKTYDHVEGLSRTDSHPKQDSLEEPLKPRRGVKVYDEMTFRRQHQLGDNMNTLPQAPQQEAMTQQEDVLKQEAVSQQAVTQQEAVPQQEDVLKQEAVSQQAVTQQEATSQQEPVTQAETVTQKKAVMQLEDVMQEEAVIQEEAVTQKEAVMQQEVVTMEETAAKEESVTQKEITPQQETVEKQVNICKEAGERVTEAPRQEGEPPRPRRGLKVYEAVDMRRREPTQYIFQTDIEETVSEVICRDDTTDAIGKEAAAEEPQRPSRGHKIYASVVIQPRSDSDQAIVAELTLRNGRSSPAASEIDSSGIPNLPVGVVKADSEEAKATGEEQQQQHQQPVEGTVPPYARVLKGSGTRELRPMLASDDDEPPPPIPPKKKGLRTISPQLEELLPPRPPRHLKPRVSTSVLMVNGEASPARPARGSKIYESVKTATPTAPKRFSKVVRIEDVEDMSVHPPPKPSRHALHPPRRRRKNREVRRELDDDEQNAVAVKLTLDARKTAQVTLTSDQENYENITISGGCPRPAARTRTRPLPPPPPPPKKGKIQQRYRQQQQQQQQYQSSKPEENGVEAVVDGGKVGSPEGAGPTLGEHHPASRPAAPGRIASKRRGAAKLQNDINENLKTIESSFATLDTVLKSLQTYSRSSPPRTVVKDPSEQPCENILAPPTPASTQPAATPAVLTASPTVSKGEETTVLTDLSTNPVTDAASPQATLDSARTAQVKDVEARTVNRETVVAQSGQSEAENSRSLSQGVCHESVESEFVKRDDLSQKTSRFVEFKSDVSEKGVSQSCERGLLEQQKISVSLESDAKDVSKLSEQIPSVKDDKESSKNRNIQLHEQAKLEKNQLQSQNPEQPLKEPKDPEKVETVPQTSVKFQEGKTLFETAVKIGDDQDAAEHVAVKSDVQTPETSSPVTDTQKSESPQQPAQQQFENPQHQPASTEQSTQKPDNTQHPDCSARDPEKVPTIPQTSLKFEEGKTLFETTVKVGDDQSTQQSESLQQFPDKSESLQQPSQQSGSPQQPLQQLGTSQLPDPSAKDPVKVATVPQTSLKFQEGKTLFETSVKVGDEQLERSQLPQENSESTQQPVEQQESLQQPEVRSGSSPLPLRDSKDAVKDPEKVETVPQTSVKFQEGRTLFETAVKIGDDQGTAEHAAVKSDVQTPETLSPVTDAQEFESCQQPVQQQPEIADKSSLQLEIPHQAAVQSEDCQQPTQQSESTDQNLLQQPKSPKGLEPAAKDPEKVPVVPQTSLKFQEGKTLFETAVKVGENQPTQQPAGFHLPPQRTESTLQTEEKTESPEQPLREPKDSIKDPEKVETVPQTSVKFQEGKTLFETAVKIGDDQDAAEHVAVKSDVQTPETSSPVTDTQKSESPQQPAQQQFENPQHQPASTEPSTQKPDNTQHPDCSARDPEKVPTIPQTSLKFEEGKTLFETTVKVGDDQSTQQSESLQQFPDKSESLQQPSQQSGSPQQPLQQLGTSQLSDPSAKDPVKVATVPQTSLKFQEGKTLFETSVKVGDEQLERSQLPQENSESTQQPVEQQESLQQPEVRSGSSPLPLRDSKDAVKDPEKVETVPQTSVKFQEGRTLFETAVKIGDDQGTAEHAAVKSDVQTPETLSPVTDAQEFESCQQPVQQQPEIADKSSLQLEIPHKAAVQSEDCQQPTQQSESTDQNLLQQSKSPKQLEPAAKDPEKVPVVPQTSLKFQEGKTLFETAVKVGEEAEVSTTGDQETEAKKTETEAGDIRGASSTPTKGKTVYETLFRVEAIKRSKPAEAVGEGEAVSDHRKQQGSAEISAGAAKEVEQFGRSGGDEQPANTELQEGVADLASRLRGIRSTLESAICNFPPALIPAPVPASVSPTTNSVEAAPPLIEEHPPSPAHTHHLPCSSKAVLMCAHVCVSARYVLLLSY